MSAAIAAADELPLGGVGDEARLDRRAGDLTSKCSLLRRGVGLKEVEAID